MTVPDIDAPPPDCVFCDRPIPVAAPGQDFCKACEAALKVDHVRAPPPPVKARRCWVFGGEPPSL